MDQHTRRRRFRAVSNQNQFARFKSDDVACKPLPRTGPSSLTLRLQFETFLQQQAFASARVIVRDFFTTVPTVKQILQRVLGMNVEKPHHSPDIIPCRSLPFDISKGISEDREFMLSHEFEEAMNRLA
jgi:hypothetical protein